MTELFKLRCSVSGCDCSQGRVVEVGGRVLLEPTERKHHGREHKLIDVRALVVKLRREGIVEGTAADVR
jgi:hypothetical protein